MERHRYQMTYETLHLLLPVLLQIQSLRMDCLLLALISVPEVSVELYLLGLFHLCCLFHREESPCLYWSQPCTQDIFVCWVLSPTTKYLNEIWSLMTPYKFSLTWCKHGQQKRWPHIETTASLATSRQMLHSNDLSASLLSSLSFSCSWVLSSSLLSLLEVSWAAAVAIIKDYTGAAIALWFLPFWSESKTINM